jgi:hypothetical protein
MIFRKIWILFLILSGLLPGSLIKAQSITNDSVKIDFEKIYAYCLDGNIAPALKILDIADAGKLHRRDLKFKTEFESRFKYATDNSDYPENRKSPISDLLRLYRDYWRMSLILLRDQGSFEFYFSR